jgi:hypothetical protein
MPPLFSKELGSMRADDMLKLLFRIAPIALLGLAIAIGFAGSPTPSPAQGKALDTLATTLNQMLGFPMESGERKAYAASLAKGRTRRAACFPLGEFPPYLPGHARLPDMSIDDQNIVRGEVSELFFAWRERGLMTVAVETCQKQGALCSGKRMSQYKAALADFMKQKMQLVRLMDRSYGAAGVKFAQDYHRDRRDEQIVADLRYRIRGGQIDPREFPDAFDAILMTVEARPEDFVPCHQKGEWRVGLSENLPITARGARAWD